MTRGTRAIVTGRLRQRSYETKEGEKRTVYELEADEVGVSLRNATAKVAKVTRTSGGDAQGGRQASGQGADPWAPRPGGLQRRAAVLDPDAEAPVWPSAGRALPLCTGEGNFISLLSFHYLTCYAMK